jgi:hypothetical protein
VGEAVCGVEDGQLEEGKLEKSKLVKSERFE